ncbi:type I restriction enzyme HsdR N-terminal domain-containing protein [Mucilaginibacter defluvii]|uniref:Type I restriction enzyme HsdR N-terminal domain-containing protein n=1 Tax=Mucilaginibacter defluvii TaxID=1196019 RepID=A0ABP9FVE2_9SPHI
MSLLQPLALPPYPFKITEANGQLTLFDELRKRTIIITPEEWVRQHFVQYLINQKQYPKALMRLEGGLKLNGMSRRTDIVVFNRQGERILMVECKAPSVNIDQKVFDQIARYNMAHKVSLLVVTNGLSHYYCRVDHKAGSYQFIHDLPGFNEL